VKKTTSSSSSHGTKTTPSPRAAVSKEADRKPRGSSTGSSTKKDDILSFEKIRVGASFILVLLVTAIITV